MATWHEALPNLRQSFTKPPTQEQKAGASETPMTANSNRCRGFVGLQRNHSRDRLVFCTPSPLERLGGLARSPVVFSIFVASFISSPLLIQALIHGRFTLVPTKIGRAHV